MRFRRRLSANAVCIFVLVAFLAPGASAQESGRVSQAPPAVGAASAILIDSSDGRVLWEKNSRTRRAIASTTKILTALVVLEKTKPGDVVKASARAEQVGEGDPLLTELELKRGEALTVEQLLYGMLLPSANDAAVALAEHVGGSVAGFARLMNEKARRLGATNSHFSNPNGLDHPSHYSTAYDLALISRAAMQNRLFARIVATSTYSIPGDEGNSPRVIVNRNLLLGDYSGANGIKTGQTAASGKSLVSSARRGSEQRIVTLLATPDPVSESKEVLDYGFQAFRRFKITEKGRAWGYVTYGDGSTASVLAVRDASILVRSNEEPTTTYDPRRGIVKVDVPGGLRVPVKIQCRSGLCPSRKPQGQGLLAGFISLLGPVLALAK